MSKSTNHVLQPAIVLFGLTSIGNERQVPSKRRRLSAARKAASKLGLRVLEIADESGRTLAAKLPAGRIHGHGDAIVPFVPKALYASIEAWRDRMAVTAQLSLDKQSPSPPPAPQLE